MRRCVTKCNRKKKTIKMLIPSALYTSPKNCFRIKWNFVKIFVKPQSAWFAPHFCPVEAVARAYRATWPGESASPDCVWQRFKLELLSVYRSAAATENQSGTSYDYETRTIRSSAVNSRCSSRFFWSPRVIIHLRLGFSHSCFLDMLRLCNAVEITSR